MVIRPFWSKTNVFVTPLPKKEEEKKEEHKRYSFDSDYSEENSDYTSEDDSDKEIKYSESEDDEEDYYKNYKRSTSKQEEQKRKDEILRNQQRMNGTNPITFDGRNGYDSEIKYSQDEDTGFGFKIEISSDMKIPKY